MNGIWLMSSRSACSKLSALKAWLAEQGLDQANTVYVGNDINDLECLHYVGCALGPSDSHPDVIRALDFTVPVGGGMGTIRLIADAITNHK